LDEKLTDRLDDSASQYKNVFHFLIRDEVKIPLPVSCLHVTQPVPFLGEGLMDLKEGLCLLQEGSVRPFRSEERSLNAYKVTQVHELEDLVLILSDLILPDIGLDAAGPVFDVHEAALPKSRRPMILPASLKEPFVFSRVSESTPPKRAMASEIVRSHLKPAGRADPHCFEGLSLLFSVFENSCCFFHNPKIDSLLARKVLSNHLHRLNVSL